MKGSRAVTQSGILRGDDNQIVSQIIRTQLVCETCKNPLVFLENYYACPKPSHSRLVDPSDLRLYICHHVAPDGTPDEERRVKKSKETITVSGRDRQIARLLDLLKFELGGVTPAFSSTRYIDHFTQQLAAFKPDRAALKLKKWFVAYHQHAAELQAVLGGNLKSKLTEQRWVHYFHSGFDYDGSIEARLRNAGFMIL